MASNTSRSFHLFNCDNLCKLCEMEALLKAVKDKVPFKILKIKRHEFRRGQIEEIVAQTIPNLRTVDYAVFVVHAAEACLSFSDDSEYGKIYEALKKQTGSGEKVFIVISGDKNYKSKSEEDQFFLSQWAKDNISPQFRTDLVDGRKSFIFSWNQKHRPIHEKALLHYFDPDKSGQKFTVSQPDSEVTSAPPRGPFAAPSRHLDSQQESPEISQQVPSDTENHADEQQTEEQNEDESEPSALQVSDPHISIDNEQLLLETRMRYGKISFESKDVVTRVENWQPSEEDAKDLEQKWKSTPVAKLKVFGNKSGEIHRVVVTPTRAFPRNIRN
nr:uncharacterized protein LOC131774155 [Pocillopora verrucosa]